VSGGEGRPAELKPRPFVKPTLLYGARCEAHGALFLLFFKVWSLRRVMRGAFAGAFPAKSGTHDAPSMKASCFFCPTPEDGLPYTLSITH
jgi:hypothetical protein